MKEHRWWVAGLQMAYNLKILSVPLCSEYLSGILQLPTLGTLNTLGTS
jgi:hypothetical protein